MSTITLNLSGLHCQKCVTSVTDALIKADGVHELKVSLAPMQATFKIANGVKTTPKDLIEIIEELGFEASVD